MRDLYSSAPASHSYAGRVAREIAKHKLTALDRIFEAVKPTHIEIMKRGKLARNEVRPAFDALRKKLIGTPNVLEADCSTIRPSALSTHENHNMRLLVLTSDPEASDEQWMDFVSVNIHLTRHHIKVRVDALDLSITAHVLARFMQRRQQPILRFFETMVPSIRAASLLVMAAITHPSRRIAIPHEDGLLLGEVDVFDAPEGLPFLRTLDRNGTRTTTDENTAHWPDKRAVAMIRTFVDADSLSPPKEAVRQTVSIWQRSHARGIDAFFDGRAFGDVRIKTFGEEKEYATAIRDVTHSAVHELGRTRAWTNFASQD